MFEKKKRRHDLTELAATTTSAPIPPRKNSGKEFVLAAAAFTMS